MEGIQALYSGKDSISLRGAYSAEDGKFSGTFTIKYHQRNVDEREPPLVSHYGKTNIVYIGKFTGSQSANNGMVQLDFTGTWNERDELRRSNTDKVDKNSRSLKNMVYSVRFLDLVSYEELSGGPNPRHGQDLLTREQILDQY